MKSFKGAAIALKCKRFDGIVQVNAAKKPYFSHGPQLGVWTFKVIVVVVVILNVYFISTLFTCAWTSEDLLLLNDFQWETDWEGTFSTFV